MASLSLFQTSRHPLPTQYRVQVKQDTQFTLTATGRAPQAAATGEAKIETAVKTIEIVIDSQM
jgi:hypothetical protein